ncbi:MAG: NADH:flavin oxidoreductase [Firmicutes bacterium]|nr:NADH:flavin oxidoreductase [Bacillota bacterium]
MQELLFTEGRIGKKRAKNRIVRSATNDHLANLDGTISDEQVALYETMAKNHVGTIITGHFGIDENHKAAINQPLLTDDRFIAGAKRLADAVHLYGSLIYGQLSQGGIKCYDRPFDINTVSVDELEKTVGQFADAAFRLKQAGYDGAQIHLAHGYFLANVLDDTVNLRTDAYGGSPENRFRLVGEILEAVREKCGEDFSVIVKLSANNEQLTPYDDTLLYYAKKLAECGIDAIELSGSNFSKFPRDASKYFLREALLIKEQVDLPIILVGGVSEKTAMEEVLAQGIEFVSCSRAFICEPEFVTNLMNGAEKSRCVKCWGCFRLYNTKHKNCVFLKESEQLKKVFG